MTGAQIITSRDEMQTRGTGSSKTTERLSFPAETIRMDSLFFETRVLVSMNVRRPYAPVF